MENTEEMLLQATLEEIVKFENAVRFYQEKYPKERSKLTFLLIKQIKRYKEKREKFSQEIQMEISSIQVRSASVDKDENIIEEKYDVKQGKGEDNSVLRFKYKKEAKIKMDKEIEDLKKSYESKTISIKPPYALSPYFLEIPENFDFNFLDPFKKFIFNPEIEEDTELKLYLAQKPVENQKPTVNSVLNGQ
jgi:hypothetical protein